jgi:signal transduction histidine kinase
MRAGLSIRGVVFLGFVLILGLWIFAWTQLSQRLSEAQVRATGINARYMKAQDTLSNIRAQVLLASVTFRDALLDRNLDRIGSYRSQLEQYYGVLEELLSGYVPASDLPAEREQFRRLRQEVAAYRNAMFEVLDSDRSRWLTEARDLLGIRVTPRRDAVIAISEGVQALNRSSYVQRQAEVADNRSIMQRELWQLLGLGLAIGIGVAVLAIGYAGRLESRLRRQMTKDVELTRDLQDLSAKLVTVQEQERRHIARELHDEIGQALTAIKVELAHAQHSIEGSPGAAAAFGEGSRITLSNVLCDARSITDGALRQVRDLSYLLHPPALDDLGLVAAVESYIRAFGTRHGVQADLAHQGMQGRLSAESEAAAYRIIQEALTNVAKHSGATACHVTMTRLAGTLRISIEDNGVGFDPAMTRPGERRGLGLIGMRERASHLQGVVTIDSRRGRGTRLVIELPVRRASDRAEAQAISDPTAVAG